MCLSRIDKEATYSPRYGYKIMYKLDNENYQGKYNTLANVEGYKEKEWYVDTKEGRKTIDSFYSGRYTRGFHVYVDYPYIKITNKPQEAVVKVEVKDIVARGIDGNIRTVIVKEMRILGLVDQTGKLIRRSKKEK